MATHQEEVVGQDGDGQDVEQLPSQKARLGKARGFDQARVDFGFDADGNGSNDDQSHHHCSLDVIREKGDLETPQG